MQQLLTNDTTKRALVAAALYAAYRFAPHPAIKTAAIAVGAVALAKYLPVVQEVV
ncbi:MAG TPA: hypothetical protein VF522_13145 [Ramlibacter sp.]|uniref:hypothetical protein n=1 Tax=Ramlibacter sp. TaxID=1917967 RepID=UPI002ED0AAFF